MKTAVSGARIEIGTASVNRIQFFSGATWETSAPAITSTSGAFGGGQGTVRTDIWSGGAGGQPEALIRATSAGSTGSPAPQILLSSPDVWIGTNPSTGRIDVSGHSFLNGNITVTGTSSVSGSSSANFFSGGYLVAGSTVYGSTSIELFGNPAIIDFHAQNTGDDYSARLASWVAGTGSELALALFGLGDVMKWKRVGSALDCKLINIPNLSGDNLSLTGTWQVGYQASSSKLKHSIRTLDRNPVWKFRPVSFLWNEDDVGNGREVNERSPEGIAGLIAEEVFEVAPDAVTFDEEGNPRGLNQLVLVGYLVKAVQELNARVVELEKKVK